MSKLRILQLSDIHNVSCPKAMDRFKDMRQELLKDIKDYCTYNHSSFDAILLCGDIAFCGIKEEYDKSKVFIEEVCKSVGCKLSQVYVVPGNHDKFRKEGKPTLRRLLNWGMTHLDKDENMFHALMKEEPALFRNLYLPFKYYVEFCKIFDNVEPIMQKCIECDERQPFQIDSDVDEMFWKSELKDDFYGYHVNLVGLNSALTCDENDWTPDWTPDGHKMYLSVFAHNNLDINRAKTINIVMMHHPMDFIINGNNLQAKFDDMFALQFYGHVHIANSSQPKKDGAVRVFSGAMQPPSGATDEEKKLYIPIYNIVELDVTDVHKKQLEVKLIVNKWNDKEFDSDGTQSKTYYINLPEEINRWEKKEKIYTPVLPEGISKREIRCLYNGNRNHKKIISKMYLNLYEESQNTYFNDRAFLSKVDADDRWVELWNLLRI